MRRLAALAALTITTIATASCGTPRPMVQDIVAQGARQIVGEELRALHTDTTLYGTHWDSGNPWTEYHYPDGRVSYRERSRPEPGTWSIAADQVCYSYAWNADGPPYCYYLYVNDGQHFHVDANGDKVGAVSIIVDIRPGDPEGLAG